MILYEKVAFWNSLQGGAVWGLRNWGGKRREGEKDNRNRIQTELGRVCKKVQAGKTHTHIYTRTDLFLGWPLKKIVWKNTNLNVRRLQTFLITAQNKSLRAELCLLWLLGNWTKGMHFSKKRIWCKLSQPFSFPSEGEKKIFYFSSSLSAVLLSTPPPTTAHCELRHLKARHNDQQSALLQPVWIPARFPPPLLQSRSLHAMHAKLILQLHADEEWKSYPYCGKTEPNNISFLLLGRDQF